MIEDPTIKLLQAFFLARNRDMENCTHKPIYSPFPAEPEFIHITCLCGNLNKIQLSPSLHARFAASSELKDPTFKTEMEGGKITKLFGLDVIVTNERH